MTRKQFVSICEKLNIECEIEGTVKEGSGCISLTLPQGYVFKGLDIHYIDYIFDDSWGTMTEVYKDIVNDYYLLEGIEKCTQEDCEYCNENK